MVRAIAGNAHLQATQEVHWAVSIRWRAQSGAYLLDEWADLGAVRVEVPRLYDGYQALDVQLDPVLLSVSELTTTGDIREEAQATLEVDTTRALDSHPGSTFDDYWDDDYPAEGADVFVSCVLGESGSRTSVLVWAGTVEAVEELDGSVRMFLTDHSRRLLQPLTDRVASADYPEASPDAIGQRKPLALGEVSAFPGPVVAQQFMTTVRVVVDDADTSMEVGSTVDFPDSGTVLVNDEYLDYASRTETTLDGLTRGTKGTGAAVHPTGSVVFLATGQTVGGQECNGPVFLLHGAPLGAAGTVRAVRAYSGSTRLQSAEVPATEYAVELGAANGALLGLLHSWPQNPDQAAESAWYSVAFDTVGPGNAATNPGRAIGAHADFETTNWALVYINGRLHAGRAAQVEQVGQKKIEKAYLLVEYGNLSNPVSGGLSVPNDGQNTEVYWLDDAAAPHYLGSLYPEDEPLDEEIQDPLGTVQTRPLDDQHRHTLSGSAGFLGPAASVVSVEASGFRLVTLPGNAAVFPVAPATKPAVESIVRDHNPDTQIRSQTDSGTATYEFRATDEQVLQHAFRHVESVLLVSYWRWYQEFFATVNVRVEGNDGVEYLSDNVTADGEHSPSDTVNERMSVFWPPLVRATTRHDTGQNNEQMAWMGPLRFTLAPDADARPVVVLYATATTSGGNTSDADGLVVANGLHTADEKPGAWDTVGVAGRTYFAAPLGTADVKRATVMWVGAPSAEVYLRDANATHIWTFSNGEVADLVNKGLTIADLHECFLQIGNNPGNGLTWVRLVIEYEGSLSDTEEETSQRQSSLKAFDITPYIDPNDWDSLRHDPAPGTQNNLVRVRSGDSTGQFNNSELNNDSLWVVRVSFLIRAAPPVTEVASNVGAEYRALLGQTSAGADSRAHGDIMATLLTGADYLALDGTTYFPSGGWLDLDTFHSDVSGPTTVVNGVYRSTDDAVALLADLADQADHALYWEAGRLRLKPYATSWGAAVRTFDEDHLLAPLSRPRRGGESILHKVIVEYDADHIRGGFAETVTRENAASAAKFGPRRDEVLPMQVNDYNVVDAASVQDGQAEALGDSYLNRFADPAQVVRFEVPLHGLELEVGDVVAVQVTGYSAAKVEVTRLQYRPVFQPGTTTQLDAVVVHGIVRA